MVVAGQRVESLNCGWVEALMDAPGGHRGGRLVARFEDTGNIKPVFAAAFVTGNLRDTIDFKVGDVLKSTSDGNFEIIKIHSSRNNVVRFLDTGNISYDLQKDAVLSGYVKDQLLHQQSQARLNRERLRRQQAQQDMRDKAADEREQKAEEAALKREAAAVRKAEREKRRADNRASRESMHVEIRQNALKALDSSEHNREQSENPNDINIDFKDRDGNWVLRFSCNNKFYHTRLGRYHNNMTQRASKGSAYKGVTVSEEFKDPQKFCEWAVQQPGWGLGYSLEKDLLVAGNKEYSSQACCFVPQSINTAIVLKRYKSVVTLKPVGWNVKFMRNNFKIFLGVYPTQDDAILAYKKYCQEYVRQLASTYQNNISLQAYEALLLWQP